MNFQMSLNSKCLNSMDLESTNREPAVAQYVTFARISGMFDSEWSNVRGSKTVK